MNCIEELIQGAGRTFLYRTACQALQRLSQQQQREVCFSCPLPTWQIWQQFCRMNGRTSMSLDCQKASLCHTAHFGLECHYHPWTGSTQAKIRVQLQSNTCNTILASVNSRQLRFKVHHSFTAMRLFLK